MNTLIKHCGELYSFKVGVREFGITQRSTLNEHEQLLHPADYRLIEITSQLKDTFAQFAASVCARRIGAVFHSDRADIRDLFPELTPEEEAHLLGIEPIVSQLINDLASSTALPANDFEWLTSAHPLEAYTLFLRAESEEVAPAEKVHSALTDPSKWREQYGNYKYAYLFYNKEG